MLHHLNNENKTETYPLDSEMVNQRCSSLYNESEQIYINIFMQCEHCSYYTHNASVVKANQMNVVKILKC